MKTNNQIELNKMTRVKQKTKHVLLGMQMTDGLIYRIVIYTMLISLGFVFLYPIIYMFVTSFKLDEDITNTAVKWFPSLFNYNYIKDNGYSFGEYFNQLTSNFNYVKDRIGLTSIKDFRSFIMNSFFQTIIIAGIPALCTTISTSLAGYGFSRFKFPLKKLWFALMLSTFIIAPQILAIPRYVWYRDIGLITGSKVIPTSITEIDKIFEFFKPLVTYVIPSILGQGLNAALFILIFFSMFNMIPKSLEEAAKIDGAGNLKIFTKIAIRLTIPGFIIVFLFSFVWYWNETYLASFYFGNSNLATLPMRLQAFIADVARQSQGSYSQILFMPEKMAASLMIISPILLLYFLLQRYFVESIDRSGITGE